MKARELLSREALFRIRNGQISEILEERTEYRKLCRRLYIERKRLARARWERQGSLPGNLLQGNIEPVTKVSEEMKVLKYLLKIGLTKVE
jgi:hypothetical protein